MKDKINNYALGNIYKFSLFASLYDTLQMIVILWIFDFWAGWAIILMIQFTEWWLRLKKGIRVIP